MNYPTFDTDLLIQTDREEFKLYIEKVLIENLNTKETPVGITVDVTSSDNPDICLLYTSPSPRD